MCASRSKPIFVISSESFLMPLSQIQNRSTLKKMDFVFEKLRTSFGYYFRFEHPAKE